MPKRKALQVLTKTFVNKSSPHQHHHKLRLVLQCSPITLSFLSNHQICDLWSFRKDILQYAELRESIFSLKKLTCYIEVWFASGKIDKLTLIVSSFALMAYPLLFLTFFDTTWYIDGWMDWLINWLKVVSYNDVSAFAGDFIMSSNGSWKTSRFRRYIYIYFFPTSVMGLIPERSKVSLWNFGKS